MRILLPAQAMKKMVLKRPDAGVFIAISGPSFMQAYRLSSEEAANLVLIRITHQGWYGLVKVT